jgi:hypothetical protein
MSLHIHGFKHYICAAEAKGLAKCFQAYADNCANDSIFEVGFNPNSGYVYIALEEQNIQIASCLGHSVDWIASNLETGEEEFFDTYKEALAWVENNDDEEDKDEDVDDIYEEEDPIIQLIHQSGE